ncbi:RIFK-like protein [Mya arenaria]|uniref:riboflavin kinase n=1 Tax=Mya arenaria TaxID=6604 RepID=A0ABY7F4G5_MYAAR|nr:RIFK-like protein [Mya arenaria]
MTNKLPYFTEGNVVKGFGRGSKELGIPTANFPIEIVQQLPEEITAGVYYGWAQVDEGPVFKMVMSIGWNPYYKNTVKSMEDFYGSNLKVCMLGFIRPMRNFSGLDELISAINKDISDSEEALDKPENIKIKTDNFFATKSRNTQSSSGATCCI